MSRSAPRGSVDRFSYVRIWRRDLSGEWWMARDVHLPLPPGTPAE